MKAITICQPYAHLVVIGKKRVENRNWRTDYHGPLLIHAGKSRDWLGGNDLERYPDMTFGAIVGKVNLLACVDFDNLWAFSRAMAENGWDFSWLRGHQYASGPYCWILTDVRRYVEPIPYRGAQGMFDVPRDVIEGKESVKVGEK